jgi:hypothetical protein
VLSASIVNPVHEGAEFAGTGRMAQLAQRFGFDLADAFPRYGK